MFTSFVAEHEAELKAIARAIRILGMDAVLNAKSGHVGLPLGGAEMATLLYFAAMKYTPSDSQWSDRDRFVLSAGHGSMLQYACLHLAGFDVRLNDLKHFRQLHSKTPGHPEYGHTEGIECTTGPLGQGIANAVGMAIAERWLASQFNDEKTEIIDHRTYAILGDGCMMEGVSHEACSLAGHLKLNRLIAFYDANKITIDGTIDIAFTENVGKRFDAYGWAVLKADAHDFASLANALDQAYANTLKDNHNTGPTLIVCESTAGKGSPKWEGKPKIHGNPMSREDVLDAKINMGLPKEDCTDFSINDEIYKTAKRLLSRNQKFYQNWQSQFSETYTNWQKNNVSKATLWDKCFEKNFETDFTPSQNFFTEYENLAAKPVSTRVASGKALVSLAHEIPNLIGGSADLAGSNCTTIPDSSFLQPQNMSGRNIHFGVREHGMAAICNGLALHGGVRPFCATFAVFSDYLKPSLRLSALMNVPVTYILTHDSYAVGEDGPTHQPIEHAWSLRTVPNLNTLRPADALETFAAWVSATKTRGPTALLLTRQDVPNLDSLLSEKRDFAEVARGMANGAYCLRDFSQSSSNDTKKCIVVASGSEVSLALQTAKNIEGKIFHTLEGKAVKLNIRVISCPAPQKLCQNTFVLNSLIPKNITTFAIEAGCTTGWGEIVGRDGAIFGLNRFGASAPAAALAEEFGFTPKGIEQFILNSLKLR